MKIVWDEPKRAANLVEHGLDFADLDAGFFASCYTGAAKRGRLIAVGRLSNQTVTVIFTLLGREAISIVSMRPASRRERRRVDG